MLKINEKWKFAAKDASGRWMFYSSKPEYSHVRGVWGIGYYGGVFCNCNLIDTEEFPKCLPADSLHRIENNKLVKHVELKVNDKVMVRYSRNTTWTRRYFSGYGEKDGTLYCYVNGGTSWSTKETTLWPEWRLPTEEELEDAR